jgi:hypothetical protein
MGCFKSKYGQVDPYPLPHELGQHSVSDRTDMTHATREQGGEKRPRPPLYDLEKERLHLQGDGRSDQGSIVKEKQGGYGFSPEKASSGGNIKTGATSKKAADQVDPAQAVTKKRGPLRVRNPDVTPPEDHH